MDKLVRISSKIPATGDLTKAKSGSPQDESDQWIGLLDGDVVAFERLMLSQYRGLFHYGLKFTADQEFVKDTIQDLFLHVWERRESLNANIPPMPYLMASLRRMMNRSPLKSPLIPESLPAIYPPLPRIEFSVEKNFIQHESARELSQQFKSLLDGLPLRQKEVIYLKFYQNLDRFQISMVMAIAPQTVSNVLQMALKNSENVGGQNMKCRWLKRIIISFPTVYSTLLAVNPILSKKSFKSNGIAPLVSSI